ncbi:MAG TPA: hypothetical protein VLF59_03820 [Candidatus Saccharimonadales bacterium]|nr:hypothetical protein [Candidatus Saccharimonadales bacterium]
MKHIRTPLTYVARKLNASGAFALRQYRHYGKFIDSSPFVQALILVGYVGTLAMVAELPSWQPQIHGSFLNAYIFAVAIFAFGTAPAVLGLARDCYRMVFERIETRFTQLMHARELEHSGTAVVTYTRLGFVKEITYEPFTGSTVHLLHERSETRRVFPLDAAE